MPDILEEYKHKRFPLKEETYKIIGACMEVHKLLGHGLLEVIYKEALEIELTNRLIPFEREKKFELTYKDVLLKHSFFADFVLFDSVILEVKATQKGFSTEHDKQVINYLALSKCEVGLLVNFGEKSLTYKRIIL
jgi:GxxExxY protein